MTSHPVAPPWNGGDKNLARTLLLGGSGLEYVFVSDRDDPSPWPSSHQRLVLRSADFVPSQVEKLRLLGRLLTRAPRVDLVHVMITFQAGRVTPRVLGALPVIRSTPFVATCTTGAFNPLPLLRRAHAAIAISARTAQFLQDAGLRSVRHIPPGVDLTRFSPAAPEQGWARLSAGDGPFLLYAGHDDEHGGLAQALDLVAQVRRRVPDVRLIAAMRHRAGQDIADVRRRVAALSISRGLDGALVELGGLADMRGAITSAHAVLFHPARMGLKMDLPLTLVEALACGRPIAVSSVGALSEIGAPPAVMVADPSDPSVVDHLVALIEDPRYFAACSAAARRLAVDRYDAATMVGAYASVYREAGA